MREIKFRAWDKDLAKYLGGCEIDSLMAELSAEDDGRAVIIKQICPARYIFEQYTGLKGKNGKEIYEGDIVKVGNLRPRFEVKYNVPCTKFWMQNNELVEEFENWNEETEIEVIGNIHEKDKLVNFDHVKGVKNE